MIDHNRSIPALALIALASCATPSFAEQFNVPVSMQCGPSIEAVAQALLEQFGEVPVQVGLTSLQQGMTTFANRETGTWTFVVTFADGKACSPTSGTNYAYIPLGEAM